MRLIALFLFFLPLSLHARDFSRDFVVVFITAKTETKFGKIPLDRSLIAKAIENAAHAEAKGVVVKFFLDQPRNVDSDSRLARSISKIPVLLQARIDDSEPNPNPLHERFTLSGTTYSTAAQGNSGWVPLAAFADKSSDVCFVDFDASPIPIIETYQGKTVKSLLLCSTELAIGKKATISQGSTVKVGDLTAPLDVLNRVTISPTSGSTFESIEFIDLIDSTLPRDALKGRVVILAYDGPNIPIVNTPFGHVGAHKAFILFLKAFFENGT